MTKYNVPLIPQTGNATCWYAAAQMVVRFHREWRRQTTMAGGKVDTITATQLVNAVDVSLTPSNVRRFAQAVNLRMEFFSPDPYDLERLLIVHGPLWYGGRVHDYRGVCTGGHVVVICGVNIQGNQAEVMVNDPWPPGVGARGLFFTFDDFFSKLRAIGSVPILHI